MLQPIYSADFLVKVPGAEHLEQRPLQWRSLSLGNTIYVHYLDGVNPIFRSQLCKCEDVTVVNKTNQPPHKQTNKNPTNQTTHCRKNIPYSSHRTSRSCFRDGKMGGGDGGILGKKYISFYILCWQASHVWACSNFSL